MPGDSGCGGELREHAAEVLRVEGRHIEDHHGGDRHFDVGEEADLVRVVKGAGEARHEVRELSMKAEAPETKKKKHPR